MIKGKAMAEFAFDIQSGVSRFNIPEFDVLQKIGIAASLAVHLRGLGEVSYDVLRKVSDHYFDIPSIALEPVLKILEEMEFVTLISTKTRIEKVIPSIPYFEDIYSGIGSFFDQNDLNEHEQAILYILSELYSKPSNRESLLSKSGMENSVFKKCLQIGSSGGFVREHRARGKSILISPYYFADNTEGLADIAAKSGSGEIEKVIQTIKNNQGWPLSLIQNQSEIGGSKISRTQKDLIVILSESGILKPPSLKSSLGSENFIFTPQPGNSRLNTSKREIYERAMACVSSVRKGQLLPNKYRIKYPIKILQALKERGYIKANSEAKEQYHNLMVLKIAYLRPSTGDQHELHLRDIPENREALDLAISLLRTGEISNMEIDQNVRFALSKDEKYIQSIVASSALKVREKQEIDAQAQEEFQQILLNI